MKINQRFVLLIVVFSCLGLMIFTVNRNWRLLSTAAGVVIVPLQNAATGISNFAGGIGNFFTGIPALAEENLRLQREIEALNLEINRLRLQEAMNLDLLDLLNMEQRYPQFETIAADIIARDHNNWNTSFNINRGTNAGVDIDMAVLAHSGLAGRVSAVGSNFARVVPIVDDASTVGAVTFRTGDFGFVRGDLALSHQGLLRLEMGMGADIIEGDLVMTSTYGDIFPPGISIGIIIEVLPAPGGGMTGIVEPIVDFGNLNSVLIIYGTIYN